MHDGKACGVGDIDLGERQLRSTEANRFTPDQLLA
jgi:hypothetical protein